MVVDVSMHLFHGGSYCRLGIDVIHLGFVVIQLGAHAIHLGLVVIHLHEPFDLQPVWWSDGEYSRP